MRYQKGMQVRRERIVEEARNLLASRNPEAFSLRNLANAAGVTVPTIYNLIGNKSAVMLAVCQEIVDKFERQVELAEQTGGEPLEVLQEILRGTARNMENYSKLYRATYKSWDQLSRDGEFMEKLKKIQRQAAHTYAGVIRMAQKNGQLLGNIDPEVMGMAIYRGQYEHALNWAYRRISINQYEDESLTTLYLLLCSDSPPALQKELASRIEVIKGSTGSPVRLTA